MSEIAQMPELPDNWESYNVCLAEPNSFYFNEYSDFIHLKNERCSSLDYGIFMLEPPNIVAAERDVESIDIPGRSGSLLQDNGRYKNVSIVYKCFVYPLDDFTQGGMYRHKAYEALHFLETTAVYKVLKNTYDRNTFRLARVAKPIEIESISERIGTFTIAFDCKPQRYTVQGTMTQRFKTSGTSVYNWLMPSQPIITVHGKGDGCLQIGNQKIDIIGMEDNIVLDSELVNAYRMRPDGSMENANNKVAIDEYPILPHGNTVIAWSGGITDVEIIPRWWLL